ncbi:MAG TPA: protein kinase [Polyangiaceae bacterium]|nr:protein kinase [Polyangiaceae bacterium]
MQPLPAPLVPTSQPGAPLPPHPAAATPVEAAGPPSARGYGAAGQGAGPPSARGAGVPGMTAGPPSQRPHNLITQRLNPPSPAGPPSQRRPYDSYTPTAGAGQAPPVTSTLVPTSSPSVVGTRPPVSNPSVVGTHPPVSNPSVVGTRPPVSNPSLASTLVPTSSPAVGSTLVPTSSPTPHGVRPPMQSSPSMFNVPPPASSPSVVGTRPPVSNPSLASTLVPTSSPSVGSTLVPASGPGSARPPTISSPAVVGPRPPTLSSPSVVGPRPPTFSGTSVIGTRPPVAHGPPVNATLLPSSGAGATVAVRPPFTPSPPGHAPRPHAPAMNGGAPAIRYPAPGDVISSMRGSYHVRAMVGQGRYGTVYEALGPFDQRYALKLLVPANRQYAEVQGEWRREAERLLLLRHPGVVYLYDAFEANYLFYMAFEWCTGSLSDLLVEPLGAELAIELTRQILAATQYLHDNDVVHDDLHSGNVLLTHADRPIIKIADFGISKELRGQAKARPDVVHHAIMAPEVVAAGYTSRQSDIYQVGLLMYWMVAGKPPLDYNVPYNDLVRQVSDGLPRQRAEQLGTPLGAVIAKMLRRRDAYRYSSARDVWEELREVPEWKGRHLFRDPP